MLRSLVGAVGLLCLAFTATAAPAEGPGKGPWRLERPEAHGLSAARLEAAAEQVAAIGGRQGLVIVRDGVIVFERYWANDWHPASPQHGNVSFSAGKSWGSALVGVAVAEGLLSVDDPVARHHPPARSGLHPDTTIRHLLTMSSGGTLVTKPSSKRPRRLSDPAPPATRGLDYVRLAEPEAGTPPGYGRSIPPGTRFHYDGVPADHLSDVIAAASGQPSHDFARNRLLAPLGVEAFAYQREGIDSNGNVRIGGSITLSVRDMARLGQLWLNRGRWDGRQLVDADYVAQSIQPSPLNPDYGFLWWRNERGRIPAGPCGMFYASGAFGQHVFVVPEARLVVATMGYKEPFERGQDVRIWEALQPALGLAPCGRR